MAEIRLLHEDDRPALEALLQQHAEASMFLRSNLAKSVIEYEGKRLQGQYYGATEASAVTDLVCHAWNGVLLLQTPNVDTALITHAAADSGRPIMGLIGPWPQVEAARRALRLNARTTTIDSCEDFFTLDLSALDATFPDGCACRFAQLEDLGKLVQWRDGYERELLGRTLGDAELEAMVRRGIEEQNLFVLYRNGQLLAQSAFNAELPDCVQVGGVFTPPDQRGRGYGGAVVAASLEQARFRGVQSAVLFTQKDNIAARRAYERIGFRRAGDFGLILFA